MIDLLTKGLSTEVSQLTDIFDLETFQKEVNLVSNRISVNDVDGRYSLTGYIDDNLGFSAACLNNTFDFVLNEDLVLNDTFFGETENNLEMTFHKVNIGYTYNRERALIGLEDPRIENQIIIYINNRYAQVEPMKKGSGVALDLELDISLGVLFKVNVKQIDSFGCIEFDKILINICTNYGNKDSSLLRFDAFGESWFSGVYHVNELMLKYTDRLYSREEAIKRSKNFQSQLNTDIGIKQDVED